MSTGQELYPVRTCITTKTKQWSTNIFNQTLSWFGHLVHLPPQAPTLLALQTLVKLTKKTGWTFQNIGVWYTHERYQIYSNFQIKNNHLQDFKTMKPICTNRNDWRKAVRGMMLIKLTNIQRWYWWWYMSKTSHL